MTDDRSSAVRGACDFPPGAGGGGGGNLKGDWFLVPLNRATLSKLTKQPELVALPSPSFVSGTCYVLLFALHMQCLHSDPFLPKASKGVHAPHSSDLGKSLTFLFCLIIKTLYSQVVLFIFTPITSSNKRCFHIHYLLTVSNYPAK